MSAPATGGTDAVRSSTVPHSGRLWSLWDMLRLEVGRLLEAHETITVERGNFEHGASVLHGQRSGVVKFPTVFFERLQAAVRDVARISESANLASTHRAANRTRQFLDQVGESNGRDWLIMNDEGCKNCFQHLMEITSRIRDDCESRLYYQIAPENTSFLDPAADPFGSDVRLAFGGAAEDIAEAAACLAVERPTACVFHLMRALEVAVVVVAAKLGATIVDQHGRGLPWGVVASNMKPLIDRMPKGSDEQVAWYRVHAMLDSVGRAWRNTTAHPKQTYTLEEARRIFDSAKAFMQELAPLA